METYWVPGINNLGGFGRWAFAELTGKDTFDFQDEFGAMVDGFVSRAQVKG